MSKETPLQTMKRLYGDKDKLVAQVVDFARDSEEEKSDASERLKVLSNRKLLRIAERAAKVKELGGRDALAQKLATALGHGKDSDYAERLKKMTAGRLLDLYRSAQKKN